MPWLDYRMLRARISMRDVLGLLAYEPLQRRGDQWRGPCPLCPSSSLDQAAGPCFSAHVTRNLFQCFRCRRSGNSLDLWSHYTQLPIHEATVDLCQRLHLTQIEIPQPHIRDRSAS